MGGEPHVVVSETKVVAALEQNYPRDRVELGGEPGLVAQAIDLAHRHVDGEIDLARLDGRHARGRILDDLEDHAADFRLRPPIGVVAFQYDAGIELVFDELIGPGTDRLLDETFDPDRFHIFLRHHEAAEKGEPHAARSVPVL